MRLIIVCFWLISVVGNLNGCFCFSKKYPVDVQNHANPTDQFRIFISSKTKKSAFRKAILEGCASWGVRSASRMYLRDCSTGQTCSLDGSDGLLSTEIDIERIGSKYELHCHTRFQSIYFDRRSPVSP